VTSDAYVYFMQDDTRQIAIFPNRFSRTPGQRKRGKFNLKEFNIDVSSEGVREQIMC
jgi:hypothetical protein